ncbi:DUF4856 domain-containing protein [Gelidibacter salicanalis]|uniref:DUF4856 domain-containing protein n=1 Tax=Gelidibacter salicanalis TaxID=291193 RepID=A0A5C7AP81_9FLAO|nr:DUF4856 domain-containing protein [Gelidibacter salicanalis]TXE10596.1 DUF4856 domain-containing protein [Gelidibacter salicanalis]
MRKILLGLAITSTLLTSCSSDDEVNNPTITVEAPATYKFTRDGNSTVDFNGQTTRIKMAMELRSALKDNTKSAAELQALFSHREGDIDFSDAELNASKKNVRNKVAASKDLFGANTTLSNEIKSLMDSWIEQQATTVFPNWEMTATAGSAGQLQQAGGGAVRYVNGKGLELDQAVAKTLIGGLMTDQMLNNYLSTSVLDEASNIQNNDNAIVESGKFYTTMEHKWDEAYGYLYGNEVDPAVPVLGADSFLNTYLNQVDADADFAGTAAAVYDAFKLGRAAIVAKNYDLRDEQVAIIRKNVSLVPAVRAVHYLQEGKLSMAAGDTAKAFHALSEALGFINSLQFTRQPNTNSPYFTNAEVTAFMDTLLAENGFWDVTPETLDSISGTIASKFGFPVAAAN